MLIRNSQDSAVGTHRTASRSRAPRVNGFTVLELLLVIAVGTILAAVAIPITTTALNNAHVTSMVDAISGAVAKTRYQSIMTSQPYTMVITTPANTYVVKNISTGVSVAMALPSQTVQINGGTAATYTYTLCPNGTVWGAGGTCPGVTLPPALTVSLQGRQINMAISSVGNVSTTNVH